MIGRPIRAAGCVRTIAAARDAVITRRRFEFNSEGTLPPSPAPAQPVPHPEGATQAGCPSQRPPASVAAARARDHTWRQCNWFPPCDRQNQSARRAPRWRSNSMPLQQMVAFGIPEIAGQAGPLWVDLRLRMSLALIARRIAMRVALFM